MNKTFSDNAIILRRVNYSEADRIIDVLTENHGKLTIRAKGIRKITSKLAGSVELFCLSDLFLAQGKKYCVLAGGKIINMYPSVRDDFDKLTLACEMLEIVYRNLHDGMIHKDIYDLLSDCLEALNKASSLSSSTGSPDASSVADARIGDLKMQDSYSSAGKALPVWNDKSLEAPSLHTSHLTLNTIKSYFILNFLKSLGYEPEVKTCANCHSELLPGLQVMSFKQGGLLCQTCENIEPEGLQTSVEAVKLIRLLLSSDISILDRLKLTEEQINELSMISNGLLAYQLEPAKRVGKFSDSL